MPNGRTIAIDASHLGGQCRLQHLLFAFPLVIIDLATVAAVFLVSCEISEQICGALITQQLSQACALVSTAFFVYASFGLYNNASWEPIQEFRRLILSSVLSFTVLIIANASFGQLSRAESLAFMLAVPATLVCAPTARGIARRALGRADWWRRPVIIVGSGREALRLCDSFQSRPSLGFRPVGFVDDFSFEVALTDARQRAPYLGRVSDLPQLATAMKACWAVVAMCGRPRRSVQRAISTCAATIPNVVIMSDVEGMPVLWAQSQDCGGAPGIHFRASLTSQVSQFAKRCLDLALVIATSVIFLPLMLGIMLALRIMSPDGPLFFGHERLGRNGRTITTWKFRTMVPNAGDVLQREFLEHPEQLLEWNTLHKLKHDPRVIPYIGTFLRKFSLDELPQLWNVLRGDMSLVGPRPIVEEETAKYANAYALYMKVRPGITGLWQISGRNNTTYEERVGLDVYYVTNWSPWLDLYILFRTVRTVLLREGAY